MFNNNIKEISIKDIEGLSIGHEQDDEAKTGVSVLYFENGAQVGCDISGGGPASRETPLTSPLTADNPINAIVLSGGSAYGLAAADGVMRCLEKHDIGFDTGFAKVPLVCQSCIFDLGYGRSDIRPDSDMGYKACSKALKFTDASMGNVGAGTGASVGKLLGMAQASKTGLGTYALELGDMKIAAVVVLNAFGDVFDFENAKKIAGLMNKERTGFLDIEDMFVNIMNTPKNLFHANTTIGCIITNAAFDKAKLNKIAAMSGNAYARCISPVGTMADGDSIYAASIGKVEADINLVGTLASRVMERAIKNAVTYAALSDEEYLKNCR